MFHSRFYFIYKQYELDQCFPTVLVRGTLAKFCIYLAAPIDGQMGIKIKKRHQLATPLATPLATAQGTLVCRGSPVGNH